MQCRPASQLGDLVLELKLLALELVDLDLIAPGVMLLLLDFFLERLVTAFQLDEMTL